MLLALQLVKGAVHPTLLPQHGSPIPPHVIVPTHALLVHVPAVPPHSEFAATHLCVDPSQHAPAPVHTLSSQHALLVVPHVAHFAGVAVEHEVPVAVQKFACPPCVPGLPVQQAPPL
jgi:hypothetical protein